MIKHDGRKWFSRKGATKDPKIADGHTGRKATTKQGHNLGNKAYSGKTQPKG